MADPWEETGPWGSASRVPTNEWFPVNTATGEWQLPGQPSTLASSAGLPDVSAPAATLGMPDQAPLAIGQVAGTLAPQLGPQPRMQALARADRAGLLPEQPTMWGSIARSLAFASPTGKSILQGFDQQQQQQLQNRLTLRRQQLLEEQETRQATQTSLETLRKISEMPNKTMRNLMFDRYVADMGSSGQPLPTDMVEAFKKSSLDEGKQMATMLTPMFEAAGIDPTTAGQILQEGGDPKRLLEMIDMGLKAKKQKADEAEEARLTQSRQTLFGASTGATRPTTTEPTTVPPPPTAAPTPPTPPGPTARPGTVPPGLDTAVTEATKLSPQVRPALVHGIIRHESNYDVGAVSPKGAVGPMQLMPDTAKDMGVDPKDPAQNVRGGLRYYAQLLTKYHGNEALALAAYNWGPGNVDKVGGDLTKMPAETQAYVKNVLASAAPGGQRGPADTRQQVAGPGATGADQAQLTRLNQQIAAMDQFLAANIGSGRERTKGMVNEVQQERTRLLQEREKLLETPRAVAKQQALQPGVLEQQRAHGEAAAQIALQQEGEKRIGPDVGRKLNLPASTKWKDVPADRMAIEDPSATERKGMTDLRAGVAGVDRLLGMLDNPEVAKMVGTFFTEPEASVNRRLGQWLSTLTPEQRKFGATLASEIMEIRHRLIGAGQTGIEINALAPMMPGPDDTDPATLRAKLEALREGMLRRHDASRDDLEGMGFRVPAKLARPAEAPKPPADPKERLLEKHTR